MEKEELIKRLEQQIKMSEECGELSNERDWDILKGILITRKEAEIYLEALKPKWISVEDRLPECEKIKPAEQGWLCMVSWNSPQKMNVVTLHPDYWKEQNITHWMPLPEKPE